MIAIINTFNRPQHHKLQVDAIKAQTLQPSRIICVCNKPTVKVPPVEEQEGVEYIRLDWNSKFHMRFAVALGIDTDYVAVFDCDTIPCPGWLWNCWDHRHLGILGCSGVYLKGEGYQPHAKFGWNGGKTTQAIQVDLVGHAWFMSKDHLRYLFEEEPVTYDNGEDIQLGYAASKHGVEHWVPPHDPNNIHGWGSDPEYGNLGTTEVATWRSNPATHYGLRDQLVRTYRQKGWKLAREYNETNKQTGKFTL